MRKFERHCLTNDLPIFASFHYTPRRTFSKKDVDGIERKSFHKIGCRSEPQLLIGRLAGNQDMSIFGAAFDASTDRWIAFNEETLAALSEHDTEVEALDACRRYLEREMRRANILQYLTGHAA
jgi:hypothetical protein